jgi:hypothetical protein
MYLQNASVILAAAARAPPFPTLTTAQGTFHPTIDNITVFADYEQLSASGSFAKIPMLAGNTDFEQGWYIHSSQTNLNIPKSPTGTN